jgi:hypothetical protein
MRLLAALSLTFALTAPGLAQAQAADDAIYFARAMNLASELRMNDVSLHKKGNGRSVIRGTLPDGRTLEFLLDKSGNVDEIESLSTMGFRPSSVGRYIPAAVLSNPQLPSGAWIRKIDYINADKFEVDGWDRTTRSFIAEFTYDGQLIFLNWED